MKAKSFSGSSQADIDNKTTDRSDKVDKSINNFTDRQEDILVIFLLNALNLQQQRVLLVLVFAGCGSYVRMEEQVEHMVSEEGQGAALSLHL